MRASDGSCLLAPCRAPAAGCRWSLPAISSTDLTGSAVQVGLLAAVSKGPSLVLAPFGGWLADRVERRRLAVILAGVQVVPATLLAVLSFDGEIAVFEIYLLMFCDAVPAGLKRPVLAELAMDLVPTSLSKQAMADSSIVFNLSRLCGPAIGGALVAWFGVAAAFGVTAVAFLGVFLALLSIRPGVVRARDCVEHCSLTTSAVIMWRALLLRTLLETTLTFFVFVGPLEQIMPVIAADHGDGAQYIGLLLAAIAVGGLLASPIVRRLERARGVRTGAARRRSRRRRQLHGRARRVELARAGPGDHRVDRRDVGGGLGRREHRRPLPQPGRDQRASNGSALHDRQRRRRRRLAAVRLGIGPHRPGLGAGDRRRRSDPDRPVSLALGQEPLDGHGPDVRATAA